MMLKANTPGNFYLNFVHPWDEPKLLAMDSGIQDNPDISNFDITSQYHPPLK